MPMASTFRSFRKLYCMLLWRRKIFVSFLVIVFLLVSLEMYGKLPDVGSTESEDNNNHLRRIRNVLIVTDINNKDKFTSKLSQMQQVKLSLTNSTVSVKLDWFDLEDNTSSTAMKMKREYTVLNVDLGIINITTGSSDRGYSSGINNRRNVNYNPNINSRRNSDYNPDIKNRRNSDYNPDINNKRNNDYNPDINNRRNLHSNVDINRVRNSDSNVDINRVRNSDSNDINRVRNSDSNVDINRVRNSDSNVDINRVRNGDSNVHINRVRNSDSNVDINNRRNSDSNADENSRRNSDSNANINNRNIRDFNVVINNRRKSDSNVDLNNRRNGNFNVDKNNNRNISSQEQRHLVFLKVHKAASTTVHNMIMRFALSRNLDVMLPRTSNILSETGYLIKPYSLHPYPPDLKFDIVCNHIIFNKNAISKYLKSPEETFYVGIVREPFSQFTSAFYFYLNTYRRATFVNIAMEKPQHPIRGFLENSLKYAASPDYAMSVSFINNRMAADFGFPMWNFEEYKHNNKLIQRFLKMTEEAFHLVMIVDMFDESMVLLRRLLQWKVKDILYVQSNSLEYSKLAQTLHFPWMINMNFTVEDRRLHKLYAPVDYALYNHFRNILLRNVEKQPPEFKEEVKQFKHILRDVTEFCQNDEATVPELTVKGNRWTEEFKVSRDDCIFIQMDEMDFVEMARKRQVSRYSRNT